jgi:hypothetical protein
LTNNNRNNLETVAKGKLLPSLKELSLMLLTFTLTVFAWIFFRAENISHAFSYITGIFSRSLFEIPKFGDRYNALITIILVGVFVLIEWIGREGQYAIANLGLRWKRPLRYAMYYTIIISIFWFSGKEQQFIYFQF